MTYFPNSHICQNMFLNIPCININEGETSDLLCGGFVVTLAVSGIEKRGEIMDHVGWFSKESFDRYSRINSFIDNSAGHFSGILLGLPKRQRKLRSNWVIPAIYLQHLDWHCIFEFSD